LKRVNPIISKQSLEVGYKKLSKGIITPVAVTAILLYVTKGFYGQAGGEVFDKTMLFCSVALGSVIFINEIISYSIPKIARGYTALMFVGWGFVLYNNNISQGFAFFPIIFSSVGIALWIYRTSIIYKRLHLSLSLFLIIFIVSYVLIIFSLQLNIVDYTRASRNHISVAVLALSSYYCIVRKQNNVSINFSIPAIVLITSFISVGTAGIISALIFLSGFLFGKDKQAAVLVIITGLVVVYFKEVIDLAYVVDSNLVSKFDFDRLTRDDTRYTIIDIYFSNISLKEILFGKSFDSLLWYTRVGNKAVWSDNLHNSYLLLHAKIGILIVPFCVIIFLTLSRLIKKDSSILFLFLAVLVRAFSDTVVFAHGYYDWSVFLIFIYAFDKKCKRVIL